ncbi:MAG TPA: carboxypeptidase regulatory-like domain-containing protein [Gemmatimonadaceae bacterium]|nr:carboxypeptidase regulatory-like domain-containing protein [Gemmatimonadaceae bacterium]
MPTRPLILAPLLCALVVTPSRGQRGPARPAASIVGYVTARPTGEPLGFADATIEQFGIGTFAQSNGFFRLRGVPPGAVTLRVRRLGFTPVSVHLTLAEGREDTVRVALDPLVLQLARIRVSDEVCPSRGSESGDTATLAILRQLWDNAERNKLLAHESPFVIRMERSIGALERMVSLGGNERIRITRVDTVPVAAEHEWRYEPGKLVVRTEADEAAEAPEKMIVPQLVDFADEVFTDNHCFKYAGVSKVDGVRRIKVDFEPIKTLREPDVRGSMFLDTASYQLVRSDFVMERPSSLHPTEEMWVIRVSTWFREVLPALPVVDRICTRTTSQYVARSGGPRGAAIETQRLIDLRFEREPPVTAGILPLKPAAAVDCR